MITVLTKYLTSKKKRAEIQVVRKMYMVCEGRIIIESIKQYPLCNKCHCKTPQLPKRGAKPFLFYGTLPVPHKLKFQMEYIYYISNSAVNNSLEFTA